MRLAGHRLALTPFVFLPRFFFTPRHLPSHGLVGLWPGGQAGLDERGVSAARNATYTYGVNVVFLGVIFVFVLLARVMVCSFRSLHDIFRNCLDDGVFTKCGPTLGFYPLIPNVVNLLSP